MRATLLRMTNGQGLKPKEGEAVMARLKSQPTRPPEDGGLKPPQRTQFFDSAHPRAREACAEDPGEGRRYKRQGTHPQKRRVGHPERQKQIPRFVCRQNDRLARDDSRWFWRQRCEGIG
jgi:hypothetical protein